MRQYDIKTGEWTEIEVPDQEPIPEPDMTPRTTKAIAKGEVFEAGRQTYRALRAIARGERLVIGANCEAVNLMDLINQKTEEE